MESKFASDAFATLGHHGRLSVFRMLMRFAPHGVRPTEIAGALDLKANTLSHYLTDLTNVGLIQADRQGRSLLYSVNLETTQDLVGFLALDVARARADVLAPVVHHSDAQMPSPWNVLFVCTGNSARSLFAEAILRDVGFGKFTAYSAGTASKGQPNPVALDILQRNGHDISQLASKDLSTFQSDHAPNMHFVFTVCDTAAREDCAPWTGQLVTGHWGLPDPVKAEGTEAEKALIFNQTYMALHRKISAFVALPFDSLDRVALQQHVDTLPHHNL